MNNPFPECWALVPVKARALGNSRLAGTLDVSQRCTLGREMVRHVLAVLRESRGIDRIAIVSVERDDVPDDILHFVDTDTCLTATLVAAIAEARAAGATRIVIVPADLPNVSRADIDELVAAASACGIAIAPDRHRRGTNGLAFDIELPMPICFGNDSFRRHRQSARALGIEPAIVVLSGLAFDLDDTDDWHALSPAVRSAMTSEALM